MMKYKVICHHGPTIDIKTKVDSGVAVMNGKSLVVSGPAPFEIPYARITAVELFRLHGSMRMIKIMHEAGVLYISVVRMNIAGYFVITHFFKTGHLYARLKEAIRCT